MGQFNQAIDRALAAENLVNEAIAANVGRWDAVKMVTEKQYAQQLVNSALAAARGDIGANPAAKLQKLLEQAQLATDSHRQRALYEAIAEISPSGDAKMRLNDIKQQAAGYLDQVMTLPEENQARAVLQERQQAVVVAYENMRVAGRAFGENVDDPFGGGELGKAARRVAVRNGRLEIFAEDDVAVTGVQWKTTPMMFGG